VRPVLRGFADAFSRPFAIAIVGAANLAVFLGLRVVLENVASVGPSALGLGVLVLIAGRAWRALALATALPRVALGEWPAPGSMIVRGLRILVMDAVEGTLGALLFLSALAAVGSGWGARAAPMAIALGLAPMLWLASVAFLTFRMATLEVAVGGTSTPEAIGVAFLRVLRHPRDLISLPSWLVVGLLPLLLAAAHSRSSLPWALVAAAATLWGYAALHDAVRRFTPPDGRSSCSSSVAADRTGS